MSASANVPNPKPLILGISGASSSGKTTLARFFQEILPNAFILHEDDFYFPDEKIPIKDGLQDWDCVESLDIPGLIRALDHIKTHGAQPDWLNSKEAQNQGFQEKSASAALTEKLATRVQTALPAHLLERPVCIVEGFLLYPEPFAAAREMLDVKIFLKADYEKAKARRESRNSYVTIEGFWEDPPGYFDAIVWPNYVRDHKSLFVDEDVSTRLRDETIKDLGLRDMPGNWQEAGLDDMFDWAVEVAIKELLKEGEGATNK